MMYTIRRASTRRINHAHCDAFTSVCILLTSNQVADDIYSSTRVPAGNSSGSRAMERTDQVEGCDIHFHLPKCLQIIGSWLRPSNDNAKLQWQYVIKSHTLQSIHM